MKRVAIHKFAMTHDLTPNFITKISTQLDGLWTYESTYQDADVFIVTRSTLEKIDLSMILDYLAENKVLIILNRSYDIQFDSKHLYEKDRYSILNDILPNASYVSLKLCIGISPRWDKLDEYVYRKNNVYVIYSMICCDVNHAILIKILQSIHGTVHRDCIRYLRPYKRACMAMIVWCLKCMGLRLPKDLILAIT